MPNGESYTVLNKINSPDDVKKLTRDELHTLAEEIRSFLVENVEVSGGHLASNLGVVELTLALLRVLDPPNDHVIWDVGHQSYVYKLLTGRREGFHTLRQSGGISGFPKRDESPYDCFGTGHSSTSLSAALGFAHADRLKGSNAVTVAIIGDGAFTGGMIYEALNNCTKDQRLIIILNENEMSISKNIGSFAKYLSKTRAQKRYFRTKNITRSVIKRIPLIGNSLFAFIRDFKKALKNALYGSNFFEDMGLYYLGPVDGNDEIAVETLLSEALRLNESVVIHLKTQKGKGYDKAEQGPDEYHCLSPVSVVHPQTSFSKAFGEYLTELAVKDERIVAITAAMSRGTGLDGFAQKYPERFFDVGIAEEHAVTFAAGLAANGMRPVVPIYSTFLQRSYDNIIHDVALQSLPVVLCVDRAGLNTSDGATHHGIFDVAFLSEIPGMKIYTPITLDTLKLCLRTALNDNCPVAIRYPNSAEDENLKRCFYPEEFTSNELSVRTYVPTDLAPVAAIVTHGKIASEAVKAADSLTSNGIPTCVLLAEFIKPYDRLAELVTDKLPKTVSTLVFLEEEIKNGGFGMILSYTLRASQAFNSAFPRITLDILATDESFVIPRKDQTPYQCAKIDCDSIEALIQKRIQC
ncbi:MAG: 1-deoxy-D-xylulose-5-phosphate synthase [Clostridia bacterium]|nr:1-deoxy-D-xylulose-5-phosphate synthase [Clostridia bacterium]